MPLTSWLILAAGTARDVSFLIDYLPSTCQPFANEKPHHRISSWFISGISLGGHSTWLALAHDPRLSLGIPIIGSPDMYSLLTARARSTPEPWGPIPIEAPFFPKSILNLIARSDPVNVDRKIWSGRKICVLGGKEDRLVPHDRGGTAAFVENVLRGSNGAIGPDGVVQVFVQDGM